MVTYISVIRIMDYLSDKVIFTNDPLPSSKRKPRPERYKNIIIYSYDKIHNARPRYREEIKVGSTIVTKKLQTTPH